MMSMSTGRWRWVFAAGGSFVVAATVWPFVRAAVQSIPEPGAETLDRAQRVTILRDSFGVPHIFGKSDADAAFGLAYAHAEDDWPLIQGVLAAARGQLGLVAPGKQSLLNDFYASFVDVDGEVERQWEQMDPAYRDILDAYADGLNLYGHRHPEEANALLFPFEGRDIARGFAHKIPIMLGVTDSLKAVTESENLAAGDTVFPGSNSHAIGSWRSDDGVTRLNINSHQPWEGPVAWYEAHIHSEEGWNMSGATFPGAPMILHGHNDHLGWAMTVNAPDRVDVYELVTDGSRYKFGEEWLELESDRAWLPIETPWLTLWIPRTIERSVHGPVIEGGGGGKFAIRHVGLDHTALSGQQWFQMNKASTFKAWRAAMSSLHLPTFNVVYADRYDNVFYVYNGRFPERVDGFDYETVLPGDVPEALWKDVWSFDRLPQVHNPESGFVQGCNSTPYTATWGPENPDPKGYPATAGIEIHETNRAQRTLEILAGETPVSREDFRALKWDRAYSKRADIWTDLAPLDSYQPTDPDEIAALAVLRGWDGGTEETDPAIGVLTWRHVNGDGAEKKPAGDAVEGFRESVAYLRSQFWKMDVGLGEVQRLRRGDVDLPLGGGPDILNCTYTEFREDRFVGMQGDSYVMLVEFTSEGARSESIHQYGNSNRADSDHYNDQAASFVDQRLKPVWRTETDIRTNLEAEYHPGEEP